MHEDNRLEEEVELGDKIRAEEEDSGMMIGEEKGRSKMIRGRRRTELEE